MGELLDLIVIGGGPGGYLAAQRASEAGLNTVLFEKRSLGGTCLNEGCVPTKTLLNSAKIYEHAKQGEPFGVTAAEITIDHGQVIERKNQVVKTLVGGVGMTMKKKKVKVVYQQAEILGKEGELFKVQAGEEVYTSRKLIIASGSETLIPPIPGIKEAMESGIAVTSREMLDEREVPKRLIIVGAGVIGLEMASYFATIGTEVTVIEMLNKIAGKMDKEIAKLLQKELRKKGVKFLLECRVTSFTETGLTFEKDGEVFGLEADKILVSIGRRAVTGGLGIETLGIKTERGRIVTDLCMKTSAEGVYAVGDVNGQIMLAHTAYRESEVAVHNILGISDEMDYGQVPSVIYTIPEIACIGETEESAAEKGIEVEAARLSMMYSGRFVAETQGMNGICKILMNKETGELAGVHMVGPYVSEMIWGIAGMMNQKVTVEEMKRIIFPHPTVSEIIKETLFNL